MLISMMIHNAMLEPPCDSPVSFGHTATATPALVHASGRTRGQPAAAVPYGECSLLLRTGDNDGAAQDVYPPVARLDEYVGHYHCLWNVGPNDRLDGAHKPVVSHAHACADCHPGCLLGA